MITKARLASVAIGLASAAIHWHASATDLIPSGPKAAVAQPNGTPGGGGGDPPPATAYFEHAILVRSGEVVEALGPNLMGDSVNEYSGGLEFSQTDVTLPGNNSLPVAVGRLKAVGTAQAVAGTGLFGNWDLEIPHLRTIATQREPNWYGSGVTSLSRCSQFTTPPQTQTTNQSPAKTVLANTFWDGYHLYVPNIGNQTLLRRSSVNTTYPTDGPATQYPIVTKQHWQISCLASLDNGAGEGFEARSPNGVRYQFNHIATRAYGSLTKPGLIPRVEIWVLPTQVTDRFGNWVRYTYGSADGWRVTSITSSDGRSITFAYTGNGNRIQSISDGTRTWTYGYSANGNLQTVTQPDSSSWTFAIDALERGPYAAGDPQCDTDADWSSKPPITGTMTHPSGAVGTFALSITAHGRTNVPGNCVTTKVGAYFGVWSLTNKTLSGPGMPAMTWSYSYSAAFGCYSTQTGCPTTKTVTISDPTGATIVNTLGVQYGVDEGLLVGNTVGTAGGTLQSTSYAYAQPAAGPYPNKVGDLNHPADPMSAIHRPQSARVITQQGVAFSNTATGFDSLARPIGATRSNSLGTSRTDSTAYWDQTALWVLGQISSSTAAGVQVSSTTFNTSTALPSAIYKFGKLQATYAFNADGTLYSVTDPLNHATIYSNYLRGLARNIAYADATNISATVNNIGTIASVTNEAGTTWTYSYDAMGRLASAGAPGGDPVAYNAKLFSFVQVPSPEYGLEANHWRQTITEGAAVTQNFFDARWRKRLTLTYDSNNPGATQRMQSFTYDPYNRKTFEAYPARSITSILDTVNGVKTVYDPLGRLIQTLADSELGVLTSNNEYLANFQKRATNPRNFATTISFQTFDEPDESSPVTIVSSENTTTSIARNVFLKPTSITRGPSNGVGPSVTRSYVYDGYQLLCKTIEPETGATIQVLDAANNVSWRASGLALPSLTSCDNASIPSAKQVAYVYDARNRLTGTGFGDGSPSIGRAYTADGLPSTVISNGSTNAYAYNNRRLLTTENHTFGPTFSFIWGYDANGHVSQLNYPGGPVYYSPNALGEATQVSGYANGVTYHPNGAVAGYALTNGIVHTVSQNIRGLTSLNRDGGILQDLYNYDANGNILAIIDQQEGVTTRSMSYDGLDRLTAANDPNVWGSGSYSYDPIGNMQTGAVGARSAQYVYNSTTNRLDQISIPNQARTITYGYDTQGNVIAKEGKTFAFDLGNRLSAANGVASYTYDGDGRRTSISSVDGTYQVQIYGQAGQLLYATRQVGAITTNQSYLYLAGKAIAEYDSSTGVAYLHSDELGSPIATTNQSATLVSRTRYEAYGNTAAGTSPAELGFTGHVNDPSSGLIYMQQRYYDPIAARFLSVDPSVTDASTGYRFNRYEYSNSNPYRYHDPDGRDAFVVLPFVVGSAFVIGAHYALPGREAREAVLKSAVESVRNAIQSTGQRDSKTPNTGPPGSTYVNPGSGQERTYGPDGRPVKDIDHDHPHDGIQPHQHDWVNGERQPGVAIPSPSSTSPSSAPGGGAPVQAPTAPAVTPPPPPPPSSKTNLFDGPKSFGRLS